MPGKQRRDITQSPYLVNQGTLIGSVFTWLIWLPYRSYVLAKKESTLLSEFYLLKLVRRQTLISFYYALFIFLFLSKYVLVLHPLFPTRYGKMRALSSEIKIDQDDFIEWISFLPSKLEEP